MTLNIFVKGWESKTMTFTGLTHESKLRDLKQLIIDRTGVDFDAIFLVYAGRPLTDKDDFTLVGLNMQNNSTVTMVGRLRGGSLLEVKVVLANDEEVKTNVNPSITVKQLKEHIATLKNCLGADQMHLNYAGIDL